MNEQELQVFVQGAMRYFQQSVGETPFVDSPYLDGKENMLLDYTGAIAITGTQRGTVFFTAEQPMLCHLMKALGEAEATEQNCRDLVGEVANTISGNARESFGSNFNISVPSVFQGERGTTPALVEGVKTFVIPIIWQNFQSRLIIALTA